MTILSVVQDVALAVGIERPMALYGDTQRTSEELRAVARAAAERIIEDRDWLALSRSLEIIGSGAETRFALPADFDRFRMGAELYDASTGRAISRLSSPQQAAYAGVSPVAPSFARWRVQGRYVVVDPAPSVALTGVYQSRYYAIDADGVAKETFTQDEDSFLLPEKLLRLCMIWMWKAQKGLPYGQDFDNFEAAVGEQYGREGDRTALSIGPVRNLHGIVQPFYGSITPLPVIPSEPSGDGTNYVDIYNEAQG